MHERGGPAGMEVIQHLTRALRRLDLSEEQQLTVREDMHELRESLKPLMQEMHASRQALREKVIGNEYDGDTVAELAKAQGALTTRITLQVSEHVNSVLGILTEEQRAELKAMREDHKAHRAEMRDKKKAHRDHRRALRQRHSDTD